jgi:hypothetical protein
MKIGTAEWSDWVDQVTESNWWEMTLADSQSKDVSRRAFSL